MPLIQNDRYPRNDRTQVPTTAGDIRTMAGLAREQRINASHVQPAVRSQETTDGVTLSTTQTITGNKTISGNTTFTGQFSVSNTSNAAFEFNDATTVTAPQTVVYRHNTSGTPGANFGMTIRHQLKSSTTNNQTAASTVITWDDATHATRRARMALSVNDAAGGKTGIIMATSGTAVQLGFFGTSPTVRTAAYTQTYATTSRTVAAYTADTESVAYTGAADGEAKLADLNALRVAYENLRVAHESTTQVLNQVLDDLQAYGLLA